MSRVRMFVRPVLSYLAFGALLYLSGGTSYLLVGAVLFLAGGIVFCSALVIGFGKDFRSKLLDRNRTLAVLLRDLCGIRAHDAMAQWEVTERHRAFLELAVEEFVSLTVGVTRVSVAL